MDNMTGMEAARGGRGGGGARVVLLLSGPQQPGRMRGRLVTGGDAALIALSWFHAHFRAAAIAAPTGGSRSSRGWVIIY